MTGRSVVTRATFAVLPQRVWDELLFYEQIAGRPPLPLRLLLPVPVGTEGRTEKVGDVAKCLYEGGHLLKRVTRIDRGHFYEFEIAEQELRLGGGIKLSGGSYALSGLVDGRTEIVVTTRYASPNRPRWLWRRIEEILCHVFHGHLLRVMRRGAESRSGTVR